MDWVYKPITEKIGLKTQTKKLYICHDYTPGLNTQLVEFLWETL